MDLERRIDAADRPQTRRDDRWSPRGLTDWLLLLGIVAVAFVVRSLPVFRGGGLGGQLGYDDGVYFAAAVALTKGVLPYRDFLLLHPPGITVLLSPFALIAGATTDATGFAVGRLAFMALGAINAGLVALAAGRYGRRAGLLAGLLYAVWYTAARVERTTDLIAPQTTLVLVAMLILLSVRPLTTRRALAAGVALGLAASIQLWTALPVTVIVVAIALRAHADGSAWWKPVAGLIAGAAVAFMAICLPFILSAPAEFIRFVLIDQLARPDIGVSFVSRLRTLEGLPTSNPGSGLLNWAGVSIAIVAVGAVVLVARRIPEARIWCALVVAEAAYLLVSPAFYPHYSAWTAPAGAVVLGTAGSLVVDAVAWSRPLRLLTTAACIGILATLALGVPRHQGTALRVANLEMSLDDARCVSADSPSLLLATSGLRRDIEHGCSLVLDPTGTSYDTDRGHLANGSVAASRRGAPGYQMAMEEYYSNSDAAMFSRRSADALTPATQKGISDELPIVIRLGPVTIMVPGPTTLP